MRAHLELIHGLLVDVRRTVHRETLDAGRQWDRPHNLRTRSAGRIDDSTDGLIQHTVIVCLEADAYSLLLHLLMFPYCFRYFYLHFDDLTLGGLHPKSPPEARFDAASRAVVSPRSLLLKGSRPRLLS